MPAAMEARYNLKSPGRPQQAAFEPRARRAGPGAGPGSGWGGRALVQQRAELRPGLSAMGGGEGRQGGSAWCGRQGKPSRAGAAPKPPWAGGSRAGPGRAADAGCAGRVGPRCLGGAGALLEWSTEYLGSLPCVCLCVHAFLYVGTAACWCANVAVPVLPGAGSSGLRVGRDRC